MHTVLAKDLHRLQVKLLGKKSNSCNIFIHIKIISFSLSKNGVNIQINANKNDFSNRSLETTDL